MKKKITFLCGLILVIAFIVIFLGAFLLQTQKDPDTPMIVFIALIISAIAWIWGNKRTDNLRKILTEQGFSIGKSGNAEEIVKNDLYFDYQNGGALSEFTAKKDGVILFSLNLYDMGTNTPPRKYLMRETVLTGNWSQIIISVEPKLFSRKWTTLNLIRQLEISGMIVTGYVQPDSDDKTIRVVTTMMTDLSLINQMANNKISLQVFNKNMLRVYTPFTVKKEIIKSLDDIILGTKKILDG